MTPPLPITQLPRTATSRILPNSLVPERNGVTVWLSNVKREGEWIFPRIFRIFSFMGNTEIDLTHARLSGDTSEIDIRCVMSNVEITVPRDIRVLCDGDGMAGSFDIIRIGDTIPPEDAPTLRVTGTAYLGSVSIKIIGPVGPGWKEKLVAGWKSLNS